MPEELFGIGLVILFVGLALRIKMLILSYSRDTGCM